MANRTTLEAERPVKTPKSPKKGGGSGSGKNGGAGDRERVFEAFRRWGFYESNLDPLGFLKPQPHPELSFTGAAAEAARAIYCGTIGAEFMHLPKPSGVNGSPSAWKAPPLPWTSATFWSA